MNITSTLKGLRGQRNESTVSTETVDSFSNNSASRLAKLNPVVDKGIVRVGGRLDNAPLGSELKHPVILPSDHQVTRLIVRYLHESNGHSGLIKPWLLSANITGSSEGQAQQSMLSVGAFHAVVETKALISRSWPRSLQLV